MFPRTFDRLARTWPNRSSAGAHGSSRDAGGSRTCCFASTIPCHPSFPHRAASRPSRSTACSSRYCARCWLCAERYGLAVAADVRIGLRHPASRDSQPSELVSLPRPHHLGHGHELLLIRVVEHQHAALLHVMQPFLQTLESTPSVDHYEVPRPIDLHLIDVVRDCRVVVVDDRNVPQLPSASRVATQLAHARLQLLHPVIAALHRRDPTSLVEKKERGSAAAPLEHMVRGP